MTTLQADKVAREVIEKAGFGKEFGHGLGMAHPHDNGGSSEVMQRVTSEFGSYGLYGLNQGVYTTMSYNDGWQLSPSGLTPSDN